MELTEEEKKALETAIVDKAKAEFAKEAQKDVDAIGKLIKDTQKKNDDLLKGKLTEAEFKTYEEKALKAEKALQDRIDTLETKLKRPGLEDPEQKAEIPGAAEYKKSFFNYLRTGKMEMDEKAEKHFEERKQLVSDVPSGRILIPEELESEIYRELPKVNVIRKYATIRPLTRDRIRRRSLTEVVMGWGKLEIGGTPVDTEMTPGEAWQHIEDLEGLAKIGKDELADTDISLEAIVVDSFARAKAETEETGFVVGKGHADYQQPDGICNGTTVTRVEAAASDAIVFDDFINLIYAVPAQYRRNGILLTTSNTMKAMRKLKDQDLQYLWQPSLQAGQPASILGYPVEAQEDLAALASGNDVAVFGDIKAGYRILDRQGMTIQRLIEVWATAGLIGILVSSRVTGGVIRADALRILQMG